MLRNLLVTIHYGSIAVLYCGEVLVLNIHVLTQLGVRGGGKQATQNIHHVCVVLIIVLVDVEHLSIALVLMGLVEHAKHLFKAVVHPAMKTGYLHYDAVVNQTLDKGVGDAFGYLIAIIVVRLMYGINDRLFYVAHLMTKQVNRNHRYSELMRLFLADIVGIGILGTKILTETQCLRLKPGFLKLDKHKVLRAVALAHLGTKVDTKHRDVVAGAVGVLVFSHFHLEHLLLEKCRYKDLGYAQVLYKIFKNRIVDWVGYSENHKYSSFYLIDTTNIRKDFLSTKCFI